MIDTVMMEKYANPNDLRRDLHKFMEYVFDNEVKRHFRSNNIPKTDAKKMARQLTNPSGIDEFLDNDEPWPWLEYIDDLALAMKFIAYDTEGVYRGYTSSEPTFIDNFIKPDEKAYSRFLELHLNEQEKRLLDCQIKQYSYDKNEFVSRSPLGSLDTFSKHGCACGVMPFIRFDDARSFLLHTLKKYSPGEWVPVKEMIAEIKKNDPYFLIPAKPVYKYPGEGQKRYDNFYESPEKWGSGKKISPHDADSFERVEGRYIERFLENIPLTMGYVELSHVAEFNQTVFPSKGELQAFKTTVLFHQYINNGFNEPKVTFLPNFEIHVQSIVYPAKVLCQLTPIAELKKADTVYIFNLDRQKIISASASDNTLDLMALFRSLTNETIPSNVQREVLGWSKKSDSFVLFENSGLLEYRGEEICPEMDNYSTIIISPHLRVIHSVDKLYTELENNGRIPLLISHNQASLSRPSSTIDTIFFKKAQKPEKKSNQQATMRILKMVTLCFSNCNDQLLRAFEIEFKKAGCTVELDVRKKQLTYMENQQSKADRVIEALKQKYSIS